MRSSFGQRGDFLRKASARNLLSSSSMGFAGLTITRYQPPATDGERSPHNAARKTNRTRMARIARTRYLKVAGGLDEEEAPVLRAGQHVGGGVPAVDQARAVHEMP